LKALFALLMVLMATLAASSFPLTSVFSQLQPPTTQQEGEPEVESDGGLTATLNGETFGKGDTVSVSGTVEERDGSAGMYAKLIDPDGIELSTNRITVGSDMTFRYGFVAGVDETEMTKAGTYTLQIEYFPPGDPRIESVSLDFEYNPAASAAPQTEQGIGTEEGTTTTEPTTIFQNITEGFRIGVPNGWVADDYDDSDSTRQQVIEAAGFDYLGRTCPENQSLPRVGGLRECAAERGTDDVEIEIITFPNLTTRYASVLAPNQHVTLDDLVAIDIEHAKGKLTPAELASTVRIESQTDVAINLTDAMTNQTLQTLPGREVKHTYTAYGDEYADYSLLVLADNGDIGYAVHPFFGQPIKADEEMPAFARQAFDTFEVLADSSGVQQLTTAEGQQRSQQNNAATTAPSFSNSTAPTTPSTPFTPVL
jgi:hypothetical protein